MFGVYLKFCSFPSCVPLREKLLEGANCTLTYISLPFEGLQVSSSYLIFILRSACKVGRTGIIPYDEKTEAQGGKKTYQYH